MKNGSQISHLWFNLKQLITNEQFKCDQRNNRLNIIIISTIQVVCVNWLHMSRLDVKKKKLDITRFWNTM